MTAESHQFIVDRDECQRCDLCIADCPSRIIERDDNGYPIVRPERETDCISCQHCLAICPDGAISVKGFRPEDSAPLAGLPNFEQLDRLVRGRRSVRQYRNENVDPKLIRRLLDATAHAPTGVNARQMTFTVIEDRAVLEALRAQVLDAIVAAMESNKLGERAQFLSQTVHAWRSEQRDMIFRGAPHMLLVSAPSTTPSPQQDVPLAVAYFELLAQAAGLGTVWCGYLKVVCEALPSIKTLLGIAQTDVSFPILFGYPAVKYARTVQREGSTRVRQVSSFPVVAT